MRKQMRKSLWLRRCLGFLLGLALASSLVLPPSSALAAAATERDYYKEMVASWNLACKVGGWISKGVTAWNIADQVLIFVGFLNPPLSLDDIKAEIERIAQYQDQGTKYDDLKLSDDPLSRAYDDIYGIQNKIHDGTFDRTDPLNVAILNDIHESSQSAVNLALAPQGLCTDLPIFNLLSNDPSQLTRYDWRIGMGEALKAVSTRLVAMAVYDPTFKSPTSMWHDSFMTQLTAIRQCLEKHRDLIHRPKPYGFCLSQTGSTTQCYEYRSWPAWQVDPVSLPFPLASQFYFGIPTPAGEVAFEDLEAIGGSKIDHDNLPVVFSLQKMIDSLYVITSQQPDLAEKNQQIPFGANPSLCLSLVRGSQDQYSVILDNCSSGNQFLNWSYDRVTGRIKNANTGLCVSTPGAAQAGAPPSALKMVACTDVDTDELQIWDWNPQSGAIKNPLGPVLTVTDSTAQIGSLVLAAPENSWHLNQQVWTNSTSSTCSGPICATPVLAAWTQGPIPGTSQLYPRDFSIFTYVGLSGFYADDVAGPVAANGGGFRDVLTLDSAIGGISASSFSFNGGQHMVRPPVGLVDGGGNLNLLTGGSVYGTVYVGPQANMNIAASVWGAANPIRTNPINFEMAFVKLQGMSTALSKYAASGTVKTSTYGDVMTLASPNTGLAVFSVSGAALSKARSIQLQVQPSATVLMNVSGTDSAIQNAGFSAPQVWPPKDWPSYIFWNFYQAASLKMSSVQLPGSVLAPFASVHFSWGALDGTLVAWSVDGPFEFHWFPFRNNALVGP